jgi:HemK-related putative methylase
MRFSEIYEPQEDSFFMGEMVIKFAKGNFLDMGTGSGIQAITALEKKKSKKIVGVDISKKAIDSCKKLSKKITWIQSDLFKNLGKNYYNFFDVIVFNPPYLPQENKKKLVSLEGGKKGNEIILRFLKDSGKYLTKKGKIILLFSSLSKPDEILNFADSLLYKNKLLGVKSLFFEELYIYEFIKSETLKNIEKSGITDLSFFDSGWRGIISKGKFRGKKIAIKTKRKRSEAKNIIKKESKWMKFANKIKIGPELIISKKDFLAYKFIEGETLKKWMEKASKKRLKKVFLFIFDQCRILDKMKVNKEEMHHPLTNIIINKKDQPIFIDFERMYKSKKPHNVTQFCQFMINRKELLKKKGFSISKKKIISAASKYKNKINKNNENEFKKIKELIS